MKNTTNFFFLAILTIFISNSCLKDDEINFSETTNYETFTDPRDEKEYRIVTIGNQTWMAENFNFNPEKCDECEVYSRFYSWYDIFDIVPEGWHLPTEEEVEELIEYLGGSSVAGGKLKESGTDHWNSPNSSASNSSGFTALPAGIYDHQTGSCYRRQEESHIWIPDSNEAYKSKLFVLKYNSEAAFIESDANIDQSASIRLIRD